VRWSPPGRIAGTALSAFVERDPCPYCGGISGVQVVTDIPPEGRAWLCGECSTQWAVSVVNLRPQALLDQLALDIVARSGAARGDRAR
jgi:hypothetical protein